MYCVETEITNRPASTTGPAPAPRLLRGEPYLLRFASSQSPAPHDHTDRIRKTVRSLLLVVMYVD